MSAPITLGPISLASGTFKLPASKSLANRALIIQALAAPGSVTLGNVSDAQDTETLQRLLANVSDGATLDCGPAGTTYRFLTAYLATRPGTQTLTGSKRMLERPIAPLVDALRQLGADITYLGVDGYPPLRIAEASLTGGSHVTLPGDISSQYLSALLLVGPVLPQGLTIEWTGDLVSRPYLAMTASLMRSFSSEIAWGTNTITVKPKPYTPGSYTVESDWSAASYPAAWVAASTVGTELLCPGLHEESLQGDRQLTNWIAEWGVESAFSEEGVRFRKTSDTQPSTFECDFETSPDLAQTFAVLCGVTGTTGLFTGLQTLSIKETDRIAALKTELEKVGVFLSKLPARFSLNSDKTYYMIEGTAAWEGTLKLATYHDHRMAMAFALLASKGVIEVENAEVVGKSFVGFWGELGV